MFEIEYKHTKTYQAKRLDDGRVIQGELITDVNGGKYLTAYDFTPNLYKEEYTTTTPLHCSIKEDVLCLHIGAIEVDPVTIQRL